MPGKKNSSLIPQSDFEISAKKHFKNQETISANQIASLLNSDTRQYRKRPVLKPPAQSNRLCSSGNNNIGSFLRIINNIDRLRSIDYKLYIIAQVQLSASLRISEVLKISWRDITKSGRVIVKSVKGSDDDSFYFSEFKSFFLSCRQGMYNPFENYNRFFVYRQYKKVNIQEHFAGKINTSVTHVFRHINARMLQEHDNDLTLVTRHLRHKNENSKKYYIDSKI